MRPLKTRAVGSAVYWSRMMGFCAPTATEVIVSSVNKVFLIQYFEVNELIGRKVTTFISDMKDDMYHKHAEM